MSSTRSATEPADELRTQRVRGESRTSYIKWAELKKRVTFDMILAHYDWLRYMDEGRRGQLTGPCPIHTDGTPSASSDSFKVTPSRKGFNCFGCEARGSIIDFVAGKENVSPTHAGKLINEWFPEDSGDSSEQQPADEIRAISDEILGRPALPAKSQREQYQEHVFSGLAVYTTRLERLTSVAVEDFAQCRSPEEFYRFLKPYFADRDREEFVTVLLDQSLCVTGLAQVAVGAISQCPIEPAQVFKPAILANARQVLLAHNHPSGNPEPSKSDIARTRELVAVGESLGIPVIDHMVIGSSSFTSLAERGLTSLGRATRPS